MNALGLAVVAAVVLPALAQGQTQISGDAWIEGRVIVGTTTANASSRFRVVAGSATILPFNVSDIIGEPMLVCDGQGALGVGLIPRARLDVYGSADDGTVGMQLRNGNWHPATDNIQTGFGASGTGNLRHAFRSAHSTTSANNQLDLALWGPAVSTTSAATRTVLRLITTSTSTFIHVIPTPDTPDVELEVSDGASIGGGSVLAASEGQHSSRQLKMDINYLTTTDQAQAYLDVRGLRHAQYRYKAWRHGRQVENRRNPLRKGLIYEDAPPSIRGTGKSISVDERVTNLELAVKAFMSRLEAAESSLSRERDR